MRAGRRKDLGANRPTLCSRARRLDDDGAKKKDHDDAGERDVKARTTCHVATFYADGGHGEKPPLRMDDGHTGEEGVVSGQTRRPAAPQRPPVLAAAV